MLMYGQTVLLKQKMKQKRNLSLLQTPAKCLKSWDPIPYGNTDTFVCLWEASNPEDISTTLGDEMLSMITCDPMEVNEIDWAEVAAAG